jgi:RND family efflux transporter MFP subunit
MKRYMILSVLGIAAALGCGAQPKSTEDKIIQAFTRPYKQLPVHFKAMGLIDKVQVKEGDLVKKGDLLMALNVDEEKAELAVLELDVINENNIKAAVAEHELAKVGFELEENIHKNGGQNYYKMLQAKAQMDIAAVKIDQAKQDKKAAELKRDRQQKHIDLMELKAPMDGVVEQLQTDLGATVDPTKPSLMIVQNNPLKVEIQVPALASLQLKVGDKMKVSHDKKDWKDASVSFMSPVADPTSGTRMIHLELPNPDGAPSGYQVFVELPEKLLASR